MEVDGWLALRFAALKAGDDMRAVHVPTWAASVGCATARVHSSAPDALCHGLRAVCHLQNMHGLGAQHAVCPRPAMSVKSVYPVHDVDWVNHGLLNIRHATGSNGVATARIQCMAVEAILLRKAPPHIIAASAFHRPAGVHAHGAAGAGQRRCLGQHRGGAPAASELAPRLCRRR